MDEKIPRYYCNSIRFSMSAYDLQLFLFHKNNIVAYSKAETDEYFGEPQAEIAMSLQHAKSLLKVLEQQISEYEKTFGTINIEPLKGSEQENENDQGNVLNIK